MDMLEMEACAYKTLRKNLSIWVRSHCDWTRNPDRIYVLYVKEWRELVGITYTDDEILYALECALRSLYTAETNQYFLYILRISSRLYFTLRCRRDDVTATSWQRLNHSKE